MPRKPRPVVLDPVELRFDLAKWITQNMTVILREGPEWLCVCPNCGKEKLAVNPTRKAWQCWSRACEFGGWQPKYLVARQLCVPVENAERVMAAYVTGAALGPVDALREQSHHGVRRLPAASLPPVTWGLKPRQWDYVMSRGIPAAHVPLFGLGTVEARGYNSKADRLLTGRVLFPIWDRTGRMVSWVARAIGDHPAKTINMPRACRNDHGPWCACYHEGWGLPPVPDCAEAHEVVLGLHLVIPGQPVIVVEGPVDAAVCGPQFVATLGARLSPEQAALIAATGASEAIVLYDGDEAGRVGARQAAEVLARAIPTRAGITPDGEDPGTLGRARALEIANTAPRWDYEPPLQ